MEYLALFLPIPAIQTKRTCISRQKMSFLVILIVKCAVETYYRQKSLKPGHMIGPLHSTIPLFIQIQDKYVVAQKTKNGSERKENIENPRQHFPHNIPLFCFPATHLPTTETRATSTSPPHQFCITTLASKSLVLFADRPNRILHLEAPCNWSVNVLYSP